MPLYVGRSRAERVIVWSGVYVLNCFLPAFIVLGATNSGGRAGVVAGVVAVWAGGAAAAFRSARLGEILTLGGVAVAVAQFAPVVQIAAGVAALHTWKWVSGEGPRGLTDFGGFAVAVMTAQPLVLVALGLGYWWTEGAEEVTGEQEMDD